MMSTKSNSKHFKMSSFASLSDRKRFTRYTVHGRGANRNNSRRPLTPFQFNNPNNPHEIDCWSRMMCNATIRIIVTPPWSCWSGNVHKFNFLRNQHTILESLSNFSNFSRKTSTLYSSHFFEKKFSKSVQKASKNRVLEPAVVNR